jgi:hypothetical protein
MSEPLLRRKFCIQCIERFETTDRGQHYCSLACAIAANPPPAPPKPRGRPKLVHAPKVETTKRRSRALYQVGDAVGPGGWVVLAVQVLTYQGKRKTFYLTACPKCGGSRKPRQGRDLRQSLVCHVCRCLAHSAQRAAATHCRRGHAFDAPETYAGLRHRKCRQCVSDRQAAERRAKGCRQNKPRAKRTK